MGAGIISALKSWFRRRQGIEALERAEEMVGTGSECSGTQLYQADVLQAMRLCEDAWESLSQSVIANCWKHAGILPDDLYDLANTMTNVSILKYQSHFYEVSDSNQFV